LCTVKGEVNTNVNPTCIAPSLNLDKLLAPAGDARASEAPQPSSVEEDQPRGLSDDDWMELMAMAEAQPPQQQQQPSGQRLESATAQDRAAPGEPSFTWLTDCEWRHR
jgi:hypothetical protein